MSASTVTHRTGKGCGRSPVSRMRRIRVELSAGVTQVANFSSSFSVFPGVTVVGSETVVGEVDREARRAKTGHVSVTADSYSLGICRRVCYDVLFAVHEVSVKYRSTKFNALSTGTGRNAFWLRLCLF
jgi:hypothetical protein